MPLFKVLGPVQMAARDHSVTPTLRLRRALLAALVFNRSTQVPLDRLAAALWDAPPPSARANIRTQIARLRGELDRLEPGCARRLSTVRAGIGGTGGAYRLDIADDELDLVQFQAHTTTAARHASRDLYPDAICAAHRALSHWRGTFGDDLNRTEWVTGRVIGLTDLRLGLLENLYTSRVLVGDLGTLAYEVLAELESAPARDRLWAILIATFQLRGDAESALHAVKQCRVYFRDALGIEAPGDVRALQSAVYDRDDERTRRILARRAGTERW